MDRSRRSRVPAAIVAVVAMASTLALVAGAPNAGAAPVTVPFSFTGAAQTFAVPAGVTAVTVDAFGAQGGSATDGTSGGAGGEATATIAVTPGEVLQVNVGGQPATGNPAAGGGDGGGGSSAPCTGGNGGGTTGDAGSPCQVGPHSLQGGGGTQSAGGGGGDGGGAPFDGSAGTV